MTSLPIITSFGGFNAAGRSSFHQAYRRMVIDSLSSDERQETLAGLATMMGLVSFSDGQYKDADAKALSLDEIETRFAEQVLNGTLVRRIEEKYLDVDNVVDFSNVDISQTSRSQFQMSKRKLPQPLPENWSIEEKDEKNVIVSVEGDLAVKMETSRKLDVSSAGQLPSGFEPADCYKSRFHPRGLQLTILAAADAINALGVDWQTVMNSIAPDELAVYASSCASQVDDNGFGGLLQARLRSSRVSSKQLALGLNSMPADFVNAYVCGSLGSTGSMTGACASLLYNLRLGVDEIKSGKRRVVIVGGSEAPITSEVIEGFDAMSALAKDAQLNKLDGSDTVDNRRASRPFGDNCGFTMGESAQYFILMDDALAIELGAEIHASVNDVFVNADGFKKSISSPGPGNYITMAKAVASAKSILGEEAVQKHSFVQAHGSSTPQNRVTESVILDKIAEANGISDWPVTSVKAYVGHSLGPASGDQLSTTLGVFKYGLLPGIKTISKVADDVVDERLNISTSDFKLNQPQVAFLNSKGFGGNNASASVIGPEATLAMLSKRYDSATIESYKEKRKAAKDKAAQYNQSYLQGDYKIIYNFGENLIDEQDINISDEKIDIAGFQEGINLVFDNPYKDMC